jgi:hypothetical protein
MAAEDENGTDLGKASKMFIEHLEGTGFFSQIKDLEANLQTIAGDLKNLGTTATQRLEETESLAAHILAIESILTVMLKASPVDGDTVRAAVKDKTAALSGEAEGSSTVHSIAADLLSGARSCSKD